MFTQIARWRMRTWDIGSSNLATAKQKQSKLNELAGTSDIQVLCYLLKGTWIIVLTW